MALLEIQNLNKIFGGLHAVNDVSFKVKKNTIKALIGPNGAGKTTTFNLIAGNIPLTSGKVFFENKDITGLKSYQIAEKGISRTYQNIKLFYNMTVLENVMLGRHMNSKCGFLSCMFSLPWQRKEERKIRNKAMEILKKLEFNDFSNVTADNLSFGQQRTVELARALATEPKILILDEPAAGLNMQETKEIAKLISKIRDWGITVLLVEHDMSLVMEISDEIFVLNYGKYVAEGTPSEIQKNKKVIDIYLGEGD